MPCGMAVKLRGSGEDSVYIDSAKSSCAEAASPANPLQQARSARPLNASAADRTWLRVEAEPDSAEPQHARHYVQGAQDGLLVPDQLAGVGVTRRPSIAAAL